LESITQTVTTISFKREDGMAAAAGGSGLPKKRFA